MRRCLMSSVVIPIYVDAEVIPGVAPDLVALKVGHEERVCVPLRLKGGRAVRGAGRGRCECGSEYKSKVKLALARGSTAASGPLHR